MRLAPLFLPLVLLAGCGDDAKHPATTESRSATPPADTSAPDQTHAVDNSAQNRREDHVALTPMDQGNDAQSLAITTAIRKALVGDASLSTNAKNLKIIAKNNIVTLRGPVATTAERDKILDIAKRVPGVEHLNNEIEVAAP